MPLKTIHTADAPKAIGPYSQAIKAGPFVFVSGQIPIDPETGKMPEGCIKCHAKQSLLNGRNILEEAGYSFNDVVKVTVFLADISDFAAVNEVYSEFFNEHKPARSAFQVAALPLGARIEIEFIAYKE